MFFKKKLLVLLGLLFTFSFCLTAQVSGATSDGAASDTVSFSNLDESQISIPNNSRIEEQNTLIPQSKNKTGIGQFIKVIIILIVIVALAYLILFYIKKRGKIKRSDDQFLRRVAYLPLAQGKSVEVVTLVNHAYVIGVSDGGINLISELDDAELVDALNLYSDKQKNTSKPKNFADVLDIFMPGGPRNSENSGQGRNENVFASSENDAAEILKQQRNKLKQNQEGE